MDSDLIESLTWREIEVLRLLNARLSSEEMDGRRLTWSGTWYGEL